MAIAPTALLIASIARLSAADAITPVSLSTELRDIDLGNMPYNWVTQQGPRSADVKLADGTANCNSKTGSTNNGQDDVPDCNFD